MLPNPVDSFTNSSYSCRSFDQSCSFLKKFWLILPIPDGWLLNPGYSFREFDWSYPLPKVFCDQIYRKFENHLFLKEF